MNKLHFCAILYILYLPNISWFLAYSNRFLYISFGFSIACSRAAHEACN
jgi:hypothetical protein